MFSFNRNTKKIKKLPFSFGKAGKFLLSAGKKNKASLYQESPLQSNHNLFLFRNVFFARALFPCGYFAGFRAVRMPPRALFKRFTAVSTNATTYVLRITYVVRITCVMRITYVITYVISCGRLLRITYVITCVVRITCVIRTCVITCVTYVITYVIIRGRLRCLVLPKFKTYHRLTNRRQFVR